MLEKDVEIDIKLYDTLMGRKSFSRRQFYQILDKIDSEYHHLVNSRFEIFK